MIDKLTIIDFNLDVARTCTEAFSSYDKVEVIAGDFFSIEADMMVSPANSFGFMDGGLDLAIRKQFGVQVEEGVRKTIQKDYFGELPVGCSSIVETTDDRWPFLCV